MLLLSTAVVVVITAAILSCAPAKNGGEGEGEAAEGEGEGEGDVEEQATLPDVGSPPAGYSATVPASGHAEACSTSQWWTLGDRESESMHPGNNCIDCHATRH